MHDIVAMQNGIYQLRITLWMYVDAKHGHAAICTCTLRRSSCLAMLDHPSALLFACHKVSLAIHVPLCDWPRLPHAMLHIIGCPLSLIPLVSSRVQFVLGTHAFAFVHLLHIKISPTWVTTLPCDLGQLIPNRWTLSPASRGRRWKK